MWHMCKEPFWHPWAMRVCDTHEMCKCDCARAMCRKMCVRQVSVCTRVYWERGLLQSCSLFQDRKILLHLTQNLLCSVNPEFQSTIESQSWDPLLMHGQFAVRGENLAQQRLHEAEAEAAIQDWETRVRSIRSSSPNHYSHTANQ